MSIKTNTNIKFTISSSHDCCNEMKTMKIHNMMAVSYDGTDGKKVWGRERKPLVCITP